MNQKALKRLKNLIKAFKTLQELGRACDDLDMEQALKNDGLCTPDVIKSALDPKSEGSKISETTIDRLFGVPDKIVIPERYIPDTVSIPIVHIGARKYVIFRT